jgi:hypothetical protein
MPSKPIGRVSLIFVIRKEAVMKDFALKLSAVIFLLVSIMHLLRLILKMQVTVNGVPVPLLFSILAVIIPLLLSVWIFSLFKKIK